LNNTHETRQKDEEEEEGEKKSNKSTIDLCFFLLEKLVKKQK